MERFIKDKNSIDSEPSEPIEICPIEFLVAQGVLLAAAVVLLIAQWVVLLVTIEGPKWVIPGQQC